MAISSNQQWWVRPGGNELNGGGFDASVSGAGTNYSNQDAAQLDFSGANADLASVAGTKVLTCTNLSFPSDCVGNIVRIASGTNFVAGYYCIVAYTNANSVTLDGACDNGSNASAGVGRMGGAHHILWVYAIAASGGTLPTLTSPLAAGHIVNIYGAGGTPDYNMAVNAGDYWKFPSGNTTSGKIQWKGYGTSPLIHYGGLLFYNTDYNHYENIAFKMQSGTYSTTWGIFSGTRCSMLDCVCDQNGLDAFIIGGTSTT
jgi:hypothetical protein